MPSIERPVPHFALVFNPSDQDPQNALHPSLMIARPSVPNAPGAGAAVAVAPAPTPAEAAPAPSTRQTLRAQLARPGQMRKIATVTTGVLGFGATVAGTGLALYGLTKSLADNNGQMDSAGKTAVGVGGAFLFAGTATVIGSLMARPAEPAAVPVMVAVPAAVPAALPPVEIEIVVLPSHPAEPASAAGELQNESADAGRRNA